MQAMHPNLKRLSHSAQVLLEACPRLFELDRLSPNVRDEGTNVHLDFGTLVGSLVQSYLVHSSIDKAAWEAFLTYPRELFPQAGDLDFELEKTSKKDFWYALLALDKFIAVKNDPEFGLTQYEVPFIDGKPAVELGFSIDCGDGFFYRGKLDAFLIHKVNRSFAVLENKTTGSNTVHEAMFHNSGQGIGYSTIVDMLASKLGLTKQRNNFPIFYPIYQSTKKEWTVMRFVKTKTSHANWIRHLLYNIQHISEYAENEFFPTYGQNCYRFNRPCKFFEQCTMDTKFLVGPSPSVKVDKEEEYTYHFSLQEIIQTQLQNLSSESIGDDTARSSSS